MGLKINVILDPTVTALQTANPPLYAQYTAAIQTAVNYFQSVITNNLTVNITFGWGVNGGTKVDSLGASGFSAINATYAQVLAAAQATFTTSPVQRTALATLPATDPTGGAAFSVAIADANVLGLSTSTASGTVGLSTTTTWAWTQSNIPAGSFDAIGTLEHEISEVLGRSDEGGKNNQYTLLDMFRYTAADGLSTDPFGAAAGARDQPFVAGYNANAPSYFSYDGKAVTLLYETPDRTVPPTSADVGDWAPSVPADSFGDAATNATPDLVSPTDLAEMNVLGYTLTANALPANYGGTGVTGTLMVSPKTGALVLAQVKGDPALTYQQIGGLGPEWSLYGAGDLLGDGNDGFLLENTGGALVVGEDLAGAAQYTAIGGVGSTWSIVGTGQYTGTGQDDFMMRNTANGVLVVGAVTDGTAQYTAVGDIGPEWTIEGTGDYLGDAQSSILMENNSGTLVVGEDDGEELGDGQGSGPTDDGNTMNYTLIGGLGPEWTIVATGNLLDHGQDDFLMRDTSNGVLAVGEVVNGTAQYTAVGDIGSEWSFLGVGDYDGASNGEFLMVNQNTGELDVGTILNNTASYEEVGQVGTHDWNFAVAPT